MELFIVVNVVTIGGIMRSDKYLWEKIVMPAYREMYKKATPKADIYELAEEGVTNKPNWFMKYYLPSEEYDKISDKWLKKCKGKIEERKVRFELFLGAGPCSCKERWEKETNEVS